MMHGSAPTAQLRVTLPRVQPAPRARGAPQYDTRRAPTQQRQHYTVPLPAALFLLLLLAFVFHRQLKSIAGEADDLVRRLTGVAYHQQAQALTLCACLFSRLAGGVTHRVPERAQVHRKRG